MNDTEFATNAAALLTRQRYETVASFVEEYFADRDALHSDEDVRRALQHVEARAAEHAGEYAAGMRHGRLVLEEELLES